ncbi:ERF family protein [Exiguobacterium sp. S3]|uniref:ERF family protein n=1 Tax=Exiguobacterium sp. S3 TaxID=483245 RepID=UPI001BE58A88|nr:ERF family protein [Exiguobacterium sp. S3]
MKHSETLASIAKALAAFQAEVKQPEKSAKNPHFKSNYVPLEGVVDVVNKFGPKHGLSYMQEPIYQDEKAGAQTMVMHESGEWILFEPLLLPVGQKATAQTAGSAITYARRYSLGSAFGIASEVDDDANSASDNANQNPAKQQPRKQAPKVSETQIAVLKGIADAIADKVNVENEEVYRKFNIAGVQTVEDFEKVKANLNKQINAIAAKEKEAKQDATA